MSLTPYLPDIDVYANILLNPVLNHQIKNGRTETLKNILNLSLYIHTKKCNKCMRVDFTECQTKLRYNSNCRLINDHCHCISAINFS